MQKHAVKGKGRKHKQWLARKASWRGELLIPVAMAHWHAVTPSAYLPALAKADKQTLDQQFTSGFSDGREPFFSSYSQLLLPLKILVEVHWQLVQTPSQTSMQCVHLAYCPSCCSQLDCFVSYKQKTTQWELSAGISQVSRVGNVTFFCSFHLCNAT